MRKYAIIAALSLLILLPRFAGAQSGPAGEWRVGDGSAHIRIFACAEKWWGIISWAKDPDTDRKNPDISKRNQPIIGLPILRAMQPAGAQRWAGSIYNAENGKIYDGSISLTSADALHVEGCTLYGLLCGGEDWTRLRESSAMQAPETLCPKLNPDTLN